MGNFRRGRPAWTRDPNDTPLRDGNRDRLIGFLTERAAKTLLVYLQVRSGGNAQSARHMHVGQLLSLRSSEANLVWALGGP